MDFFSSASYTKSFGLLMMRSLIGTMLICLAISFLLKDWFIPIALGLIGLCCVKAWADSRYPVVQLDAHGIWAERYGSRSYNPQYEGGPPEYKSLSWHQIRRVERIQYLGLNYLILHSGTLDGPLLIPLFLNDLKNFKADILKFAPPNHPLRCCMERSL